MNVSLSVLLPVYNAEERLGANVAEILDVLPELTPRFEVVIIDDGSVDETAETAYGLARCYPQVNVVCHPLRLGLSEAIHSGLECSGGEIVFVGDELHGLDPQDLRKLWQIREGYVPDRAPGAEASASGSSTWIDRLLNWRPVGRSGGRQLAGMQIIQRQGGGKIQSLRSMFQPALRIDRPTVSRPNRANSEGNPKRHA